MSWQGQMGTIVRYLIDDTDSDNYEFSPHRIETTILVAAQLSQMSVEFAKSYDVNVENCRLDPDPTTGPEDNAFITLVCLRAACIITGSKLRSESGNAISFRDGPSSIQLNDSTQTIALLYKDLCEKHKQAELEYRAGNSLAGQAILGPYSPGSNTFSRNGNGHRAGGFFEY